jgi:predicted AAA+ superfamily ATPase
MDYFWETPNWDLADKHLSGIKKMPFVRDFPNIPLNPGLNFIRGPRQIGKTSWLKTILKDNCKTKKCFFLSCENMKDHIDLAELLKSLKDIEIFLLDEVTFVDDWWRAIKHEIDRSSTKVFVLTGSNTTDLRRGADQMPGRWADGGEIFLLPMEFPEFQLMRKRAGWPNLSQVDELELYFRIGGFPIALAEAGKKGNTPVKTFLTYQRWLVGDFLKLGKQEQYLKEILLQIATHLSSGMSLQSLAQKTQMGSHHTAQEYISILTDCFAVKTLFFMDENGDFKYRKEKKFYFTDPLVFWATLDLLGMSPPENAMSCLAEQVAHESLSRRFKRFGYIKGPSGEVDFYAAKKWAIEVKWSRIATNISKMYKDIRCPEKIIWTQSNFLNEWPKHG